MFLVTHMVLDGIPPLAHRKQKRLTEANIPDGTVSIGDAAFSLCPLIKQVTIPASVEYIGVAAFCASGLEEVVFLGVPKFLEPSIFAHCERLKRVLVLFKYSSQITGRTLDFSLVEHGRTLLSKHV